MCEPGRDPLAIHEGPLTPMLLALFDPWLEKLPDAAVDQFVQHLEHMIDLFHEQPRALGLLEPAAGGLARRCPLDRRHFCTTSPNHG